MLDAGTWPNTDPECNADRDAHGRGDSYAPTDGNPNSDSYGNTNSAAHRCSYGNAYGCSDGQPYSGANTERSAYCKPYYSPDGCTNKCPGEDSRRIVFVGHGS